jgi:alpha-D-xyloside xylohydrolase
VAAFAAIRQLIALRYQLSDYVLTSLQETSRTGLPFNRPLFFDFPKCAPCWNITDQYMMGTDMLAAPITTANTTSRSVYLPILPSNATWRHFFTNREYHGGVNLSNVASPTFGVDFPLFVRTDRPNGLLFLSGAKLLLESAGGKL